MIQNSAPSTILWHQCDIWIPPLINVFSFTGITIFLIMKPNLAYGQLSCSALYIAAYVPTSLGPFFVSQISILRWIIVRTKIRECIEQEKTRKNVVVTLLILGLTYHAICFSIGIKNGSPLGILQQVNLIRLIFCRNNCWIIENTDNISFEAFLVGNQGWRIKGQMLR